MNFSDTIHIEVHALRIVVTKPTAFEQKMSRIVAEEYASECKECKHKAEQYKYQQIVPTKKGFMEGLFGQ